MAAVSASTIYRRSVRIAAFDDALRAQCPAGSWLAGVDEAGRGPLAGPVVAAAVVLKPGARIRDVYDSKQLSEEEREDCRAQIEKQAVAIGVGIVGPEIIDAINILEATLVAARVAVDSLSVAPAMLMTDYLKMRVPGVDVRWEAEADAKSLSVAAASVIAKTTRDRMMRDYAADYPDYLLEKHKGYGTPEHWACLNAHGPCNLHRLTFAGVGMFSSEPRPSMSFQRLAHLRTQGGGIGFFEAARETLTRSQRPLVEAEAKIVRQWLEA